MGNSNNVEKSIQIPTYQMLLVSHPLTIEGVGNTISEAFNNLNKKCQKKGYPAILNIPDRSQELEDFNWYCDTFVIISTRGGCFCRSITTYYNVVLFKQRGDKYIAFINVYRD